MDDIEPIVKKYCDGMADTLTETMARHDYPEYQHLWKIFIEDIRRGEYYRHFNFLMVNGVVAVQARTNVGQAITDYTDGLREGK
ncbi:MAG TPA: hypothetical protein DET40_04835 [Lentisphaeria bacterium]|nr:MAG: hypothetical protein A2X45_13410 [Lentisphaerae bacterium GWF2_50_93]HCE42851.1 hypothetical protein [Lentisphaeria bacterium]